MFSLPEYLFSATWCRVDCQRINAGEVTMGESPSGRSWRPHWAQTKYESRYHTSQCYNGILKIACFGKDSKWPMINLCIFPNNSEKHPRHHLQFFVAENCCDRALVYTIIQIVLMKKTSRPSWKLFRYFPVVVCLDTVDLLMQILHWMRPSAPAGGRRPTMSSRTEWTFC